MLYYNAIDEYKNVIKLQTGLGDVDAARITFAQMEEHFVGDDRYVLFAKADAMSNIGKTQYKIELSAA